MNHVVRLDASAVAEVVDVLADAFAGYPVMNFVLGPDGDVDARLRQLIGFFVFRRINLGGPMFGVRGPDGHMVGAAVMTLPHEPEPSVGVLAARDALFQNIGTDCRDRHEAYAAAARTFAVREPHHHLNMLGVRKDHHGRGLARPLLEAVFDLVSKDSESAGVSLTTETTDNVRLYEHFGFDVIGHASVAGAFQTWGLFRQRTTRDRNIATG